MAKEFPALEKYLNAEPKFKIKSAFDDLEEDISNHWIFCSKYTDYEKETLRLFNPNSVAFMTLEQKAALYKSKKLRDIDPKNKLYDAMVDKIDDIIIKYFYSTTN